MYINYFKQWSFAMLFMGAVLMLGNLTNTTWALGLFFLGAGVVIGGIATARSVARWLRRHDHDPRRYDKPWPGAEGFP